MLYGTGDLIVVVASRVVTLALLAMAYYFALRWAVGLTAPLSISELLGVLGFGGTSAAYVDLAMSHTLAVLFVAAPIAGVISWLFPRRYLACGVAVTIPVLLEIGFQFFLAIRRDVMSTTQLVFWVGDILKLALAIPVLAWLFLKYVPYNTYEASRCQ
jgi:hypothetical protein